MKQAERHEAAVFPPGTLWARVQTATRRALDSGALQPIPTDFEHLEDGGIRFLVRILRHLARKPRAEASARTWLASLARKHPPRLPQPLGPIPSCRTIRRCTSPMPRPRTSAC